jgi:hypothetical protein
MAGIQNALYWQGLFYAKCIAMTSATGKKNYLSFSIDLNRTS